MTLHHVLRAGMRWQGVRPGTMEQRRRSVATTRKGDTWNESELYTDAWTLRRKRRVTSAGLYNETPTYHTRTAWTADGQFFILASARDGQCAAMRCHAPTGDITQLVDWVDGVGVGGMQGYRGGQMAVAPRSGWVFFHGHNALRSVHITTLEERTIVADLQGWRTGTISVDPTESWILYPQNQTWHEQAPADDPTGGWRGRFRLMRVAIAGGKVEQLWAEEGLNCNHVQLSPVDGDLALVDRDLPPHGTRNYGRMNRIWALRLSTGALTELPSQIGSVWQTHSVWAWDGSAVYYHCPSPQGWAVGVIDPAGQPIWEQHSAGWQEYGHVSAMAGRPAILLDGTISSQFLLWMYYDRALPRIEVIARHDTNWGGHEGQLTHPHPQSSPDGRRISFNTGDKGRSDVWVLDV